LESWLTGCSVSKVTIRIYVLLSRPKKKVKGLSTNKHSYYRVAEILTISTACIKLPVPHGVFNRFFTASNHFSHPQVITYAFEPSLNTLSSQDETFTMAPARGYKSSQEILRDLRLDRDYTIADPSLPAGCI
jgi:hypothetical protein